MAGVDILATAFSGANAAFIADLYARWTANPASVDPSFDDLFRTLNDESRAVLEDAAGASWAPRHFSVAEADPARPAEGRRARPRDRRRRRRSTRQRSAPRSSIRSAR